MHLYRLWQEEDVASAERNRLTYNNVEEEADSMDDGDEGDGEDLVKMKLTLCSSFKRLSKCILQEINKWILRIGFDFTTDREKVLILRLD